MDLKTELQNFKVINLEEIAQGDVQVPDNIRNSIFLYNKAIESLRTGSEDIAIIELKKATSMNPHFYEAMNLLGVCYNYAGDSAKAAEIFEKVVKAESNSIVAMNYLQRMGLGENVQLQKSKPFKKTAEQPGEPLKRIRTEKTTSTPPVSRKRFIMNAVKIGAGFAAGLLLSAIIFSSLPEKKPQAEVPQQNTTSDTASALQADFDAKYNELKNRYDLLQQDKDNAVLQADYYKAALKLYEIEALANKRNYEKAADMLLLMKTVEFRDAEKEKYDGLYGTVMPLAAKSVYDQGYKHYNSRRYQEALKALEKVQMYYPEFKRMDAALYYMGRSCQALNDSRSAVAYYQKLISEYPSSSYAKSANSRIKELTQIP